MYLADASILFISLHASILKAVLNVSTSQTSALFCNCMKICIYLQTNVGFDFNRVPSSGFLT